MQDAPSYVVLQYNGCGFAGWQYQPSERTVQGELEKVLERLIGSRVVTRAAGRTDTGVHALSQIVSFSVPSKWEPEKLLRALRALLPGDIWAKKVERAPDGFDARRHATARRYRYVLGCDDAAFSPFRRPYEWALGKQVEGDLLHEASAQITGKHDFRGFSAKGQVKEHYECDIGTATWCKRDDVDGFIFEIEADRFLHRMVRFLVGMMVDVARRRRPLEDVTRVLLAKNNELASPPAPASGLFLLGARYPQFSEVIDR